MLEHCDDDFPGFSFGSTCLKLEMFTGKDHHHQQNTQTKTQNRKQKPVLQSQKTRKGAAHQDRRQTTNCSPSGKPPRKNYGPISTHASTGQMRSQDLHPYQVERRCHNYSTGWYQKGPSRKLGLSSSLACGEPGLLLPPASNEACLPVLTGMVSEKA